MSGNNPVGSGPFKFDSYATGDRLTLVKNPDYAWGPRELGEGAAELDELVFRIVADDSGRYNALQSGQLQIAMNLPPNSIAAAAKTTVRPTAATWAKRLVRGPANGGFVPWRCCRRPRATTPAATTVLPGRSAPGWSGRGSATGRSTSRSPSAWRR